MSNVQHEQEQTANGIDAQGKPVLTKVEDFGIKLAHQFPWAPAAAVAVGLALRRRFLSSPDAPSGVVRRLQVTKVPHLPIGLHTYTSAFNMHVCVANLMIRRRYKILLKSYFLQVLKATAESNSE